LGGLLCLLVLGAVLLVSRTQILAAFVLPRLSQAIGCEAEARRVEISAAGTITFIGLRLIAPGVEGPAAVFAEVPRLEIKGDWSALFSGLPRLNEVVLRNPVFRLSQDADFNLNIRGLRRSGASAGMSALPEIEITDGRIEIGEHGMVGDRPWYTNLTSIRATGHVRRTAPGASTYRVTLHELPMHRAPAQTPLRAGLDLRGEFDLRDLSASIRLGNISLDRWRDTSVPTPLRDLWSQMRLSGEIQDAEFVNDPKTGPSARMRLVTVDLNIPVPAEDEAGEPAADPASDAAPGAPQRMELLRMRRVSGLLTFGATGVTAALNGWIEDLECHVDLTTRGYDPARCGLTCRILADRFIVDENPRLLPFAPTVMKDNFIRFSGPEAVVDGTVDLVRAETAEDGAPAPISVKGYLEFRDGAAQFDRFRYPFTSMEGTVMFDDDKVELTRITGIGPTGARLLARAVISPLTEDAGVDVHVTVTDVPLDEHLRRAVPAARRNILDALFSEDALRALVEQGLVVDPAAAAALKGELEEANMQLARAAAAGDRVEPQERQSLEQRVRSLESRLRPPEFALGGNTEIKVHVQRTPGPDSEYVTQIEARVPGAGLLPEAFPYPVVAEMLTITMTDVDARAEAPRLTGLSGARGALDAAVSLGQAGEPDTFEIHASAVGAPVDGFLVAALPARAAGAAATSLEPEPGSEEREWSPRRLVKDLGLAGKVDCNALVFSRENDETGYDVNVLFEEMSAAPGGGDPLLRDLAGRLRVSHDGLNLSELRGTIQGAPMRAELSSLRFGKRESAPTSLSGRVDIEGLDLEAPVERFVGALSPSQARRIQTLRAEHKPVGHVNATLLMSTRADTTSYLIEFTGARGVSFDVPGARIGLVEPHGRVSAGPARLIFDDVSAAVTFDGESAGSLSLDGSWPFGSGGSGVLDLALTEGRFEMPLMRALAGRISPALSTWAVEHNLRGRFSAEGRAATGTGGPSSFTGAVRPHSAEFTHAGSDVVLHDISGEITTDDTGGRIQDLRLSAPAWSIGASGTWTREGFGAGGAPNVSADMAVSLESRGLPPDLMAVLPGAARTACQEVGLAIDGPVSMRDGSLHLNQFGGPGVGEARFSATADFSNGSISAPFPVTDASGSLRIDVEQTASSPITAVAIDIDADSLRVMGVPITDAAVAFRSATEPGVWTVPSLTAEVLGGSVVASGVVRDSHARGEPGPVTSRSFEASLKASRIDFAGLIAALQSRAEPAGQPPPDPLYTPGSRGLLDGDVALAGTLGPSPQRRGRGVVRVEHGRVMALPGIVPLLELSNLQMPTGEALDWASALFFLEGSLVTFEKIEVSSDSLIIAGDGTMQLPGTELNLQFNSRGGRNIPIVGDLLRGLRNELVTTVVTGTLREPDYRLEQLPATRRMLGTIFRSRPRPPAAVSSANEASTKEPQ